MAALPVINATIYFILAIRRLPERAKIIALFDPWLLIYNGMKNGENQIKRHPEICISGVVVRLKKNGNQASDMNYFYKYTSWVNICILK
jgi:hypothetical protein